MLKLNVIDKKYFIISFFIHLTLILIVYFALKDNQIRKDFIVYGIYSKKPSQAYFKPNKKIVKGSSLNQNYGRKKTGKKVQSKNGVRKKISSKAKSKINEKSSVNTKAKVKSKKIKAKKIESRVKEFKNLKEIKDKQKIKDQLKAAQIAKKEQEKKEREAEALRKKELEKELEAKRQEELKKEKEEQDRKKEEEKAKTEAEEKEDKKEIEEKTNQLDESKQDDQESDQDIEEEEEELNFSLDKQEVDEKLAVYQKHIKKEVERLWHPPVGISKGTECTIFFMIDNQGEVKDFQIVKRSNILIYDLSVLRIAKSFKFDKSLWGKKFKVIFRQ